MPPLQVRDCPEDVYEELRAYAASENRSISQQTLTIIQDRLRTRSCGAPQGQSSGAESRSDLCSGERLRAASSGVRSCAVPLAQGSLYSSHQDEEDYLSRRKRAFSRIDELPAVSLPKKYDSSAAFVRAAREERW